MKSNLHNTPAAGAWSPASLGGGGYITGLLQHPANPAILYSRCDVAGIFRSENAGETWRTLNRGMTLCHHHSVQSFAMDPHDPRRLLRASGEARDGHTFGDIHLSEDGGETWSLVCAEADFYGNGPTRQCGEVLAFDPHRPGVVLAGAFSKGLFRSADGGRSWSHIGYADERFTHVVFHPTVPGLFFAGTQSDLETHGSLETLHKSRDRVRRADGALFVSRDQGETWSLVQTGFGFAEIVPHPASPDVLCAANRTHGILRSTDGGRSWDIVDAGLPGCGHLTLCASPFEADVLFTAANIRPSMQDKPLVAIYRSADFGRTWQLVHDHQPDDLRDYPAHLTPRHCGWAISKVRCDLADPRRLFYTNWYGVWRSDDAGRTWSAHQFQGLETTCIECAISDPRQDRFWIIATDHPPYSAPTAAGTFHAAAPIEGGFSLCTAVVASADQPGHVLVGLGCHHYDPNGKAAIARVEDGKIDLATARTWPRLFVQALTAEPGLPGAFLALFDGAMADGAGLWRSTDFGGTWQRLAVQPWPAHAATLPAQRDWVEAEVLSVVIYQTKNICGTNQLVAADPCRPGRWFVGEPTEGLRVTEDFGATWRDITPPIAPHRAALLVVVRCHPARSNWLYAGFLREGLWRSTDAGSTWTRVDPGATGLFNASALAIGGPDGDTLAVASEPLYWAPNPSRVLLSRDAGATWTDVSPNGLGALRWKGLALDARTETLLGVTCGNGAFRLSLP